MKHLKSNLNIAEDEDLYDTMRFMEDHIDSALDYAFFYQWEDEALDEVAWHLRRTLEDAQAMAYAINGLLEGRTGWFDPDTKTMTFDDDIAA